MSEDVKPRKFYINEDKLKENSGIDYVATEIETRRFSGIAVIELEPTMRLMDEMYDVIKNHNCFKGTTYFDGEDRVITECKTCDILEKYKKFKEVLK